MLADGTVKPDQNAVFSPTSIAMALAMARAGAKGETASQMDTVLHAKGWDELGVGVNALDQALTSDAMAWQDDEGRNHEVTLKITNSVFAQQGWSLQPAYLTRIAQTFDVGVHLVDYIANATRLINAWVSVQTRRRIPHLIPDGVLTEMTRLVLVNTIYLKANWAREFQPGSTRPLPFTRLDGSQVDVPTMQQAGEQDIPYAHGTGWQATELLYGRQGVKTSLAMTLIMPTDLPTFERQLTVSELGRINGAVNAQRELLSHVTYDPALAEMDCGHYAYQVDLHLPRFSAATTADLPDILKALGMPLAFSGAADFSPIHVPTAQEGPIHIGTVIHRANIDVDEKGTTAAAATALSFDTGGCTGPSASRTIQLHLDHPFLFVVRDVETGAVLFMGHVVEPGVGR
jgi:serpin B